MARPDALSWQFLEKLSDLLSVVQIANGWRTDLGKAISLEDDYANVNDKPGSWLFLGTLDMPIDAATSSRTIRTRLPNLTIEFAIPAKLGGAWKLAHNGLADLLEALPESSIGFPVGAGKLALNGTSILRRPEGFPVIVAQVTARVNLTERKPTAQ